MMKFKKKIIVSLMGVDGSGKTTLARKLQKIFKRSNYLHLKPYILFQDRRTVIQKPQNQKKSFFFQSLLRLLSWLISYKVFFYQNKKKEMYIFDRYVHDVLIDPLRYKHGLPQGLTKHFLNFFPQPDLWIFLNTPLKIIVSRKQELPYNELRRQIRDYTKFFKNKKNVLNINSNIKKKELTQHIKKKISNFIR